MTKREIPTELLVNVIGCYFKLKGGKSNAKNVK